MKKKSNGIKKNTGGIAMLVSTLTSALTSVSTWAHPPNFDDILACYANSEQPGIAVRIEQNQELVYSGAHGLSDLDSKTSLSTGQVFQIGSLTKSFTAVAILKLVEQGKVALSDTLGQHIPNLKKSYADKTIRRVLSHTAGLPNYLDNSSTMRKSRKAASMDKVVKQLQKDRVKLKAGEQWAYSNTGYVILGKLIEAVSQQSYPEFMQQHIFEPYGLKHTQVVLDQSIENMPTGYRHDGKQFQAPLLVHYSWISGAGAIATTLEDVGKWHAQLKQGSIISDKHYQLMTTKARLNSGQEINHGLGMEVFPISGKDTYSYLGQVPGFMAWMVYFKEADVFATAFTNNENNHPGPALLHMVAEQIDLTPNPVLGELNLEQVKPILGQYKTEDGDIRTISFKDGQLYAAFNEESKQALMLRENNAFSYACNGDFFQLRETDSSVQLIPNYLFFGQGKPEIRQ